MTPEISTLKTMFSPVLDNAMVGHTYLTLISLPEEKKIILKLVA